MVQELIANAGPAHERREKFLQKKGLVFSTWPHIHTHTDVHSFPQLPRCIRVQQCRREWARVLSACAGTTVPGASGSWSIPNIGKVTEAYKVAKFKAATALAEAKALAPPCGTYKRMNVFIAKCKKCRRSQSKCQRSREAHETRQIQEKKVSEAHVKMIMSSSAVSLLRFMSQRPGLVRAVGVRVLRYYDINAVNQ